MKAIVIDGFGGPEVMKYKEVERPEPKSNEVEIHVAYAGINPVDWKIREGLLKTRLPHVFPIILGWDVAGIVSRIGSNVKQWKEGDTVYAYARKSEIHQGAWAEYICLDETVVSLKPKNLLFREAAAIPLVTLTAWQSLVDAAKICPKQHVLIHAGAGGVGSMAIQIAKHFDAKVYATASAKNALYVTEMGADVVIDYTQNDFVETIRALVPEGLDIAYDTVGGDTLEATYPLVKKNGTLVSICSQMDPSKGKEFGINLQYVFVRPDRTQLEEITRLLENGKLVPPFIEDFPLEQAAAALEKQKAGHVRGKIVLKVGDLD